MTRKYTGLPYTEYTTTAFDGNRLPITNIIIHSTVATVASAIATFSSPTATTSAHYIVGNDGKLFAGLEEYYVAYHSGNYGVNQQSIGIEHEWYNGIHPTDQLYAMSARLVADICKFYNLGCNRGVVKAHKEIVPTSCPNEIDVDRIVREANVILNPLPPAPSVDQLQQTIRDQQATIDRITREKAVAIADANALRLQQLQELKDKIRSFANSL